MANSSQYSTGGEPSVRGKYVKPLPPTIGTATDVGLGRAFNNGAAYVGFIPDKTGAGTATTYTATSSPGGFTAVGSSSPILVTGLQSATAYTFTVRATNSFGSSVESIASNSVTATTVPQTPNAPTATAGVLSASLAIVATATGGKAISSYNAYSSSGRNGRGLSPVIVGAETAGVSRTYSIEAVNANGASFLSPNSFAVTPTAAPVPLATVSSTTGSPTVDTTSRPGKTIYSFNGSGSITFGVAGTCEVLTVGGGGAGGSNGGGITYGSGGGGAGGHVYNASAFVAAATYTVTVGAGGSSSTGNASYGIPSTLSNSSNSIVFALPGGGYGQQNGDDLFGGAGASSAGRLGNNVQSAFAVTTNPFTQGNTGGGRSVATAGGGGGGGGASAVGTTSTTNNGAAGGAGTANSITGTSVTRAGGGGGGAGTNGGNGTAGAGGAGGGAPGVAGNAAKTATNNGTANTGGGGGGSAAPGSGGGTGGSGVVIVVVG